MTTTKKHSTRKPAPNKLIPSGGAGLKGIPPNAEITKEVVSKGADFTVWLLKLAVVGVIGIVVYNKITNRFKKWNFVSNYPISNISQAEARSRVNSIIGSMSFFDGFGNEFETVSQSIADLNYNGFIMLYNEFGKQDGHLTSGKLTLIEWIYDQFDKDEIAQLSFLMNGNFIK